jgi:cellulose synthase/poly-beta-1,6-N-acetylglucosamine synthase-like glycosyltransferase
VTAIILFLIGAGLLLYVLFGYPVLLALRARLFARPVERGEQWKSVSVLLAVKNGEKFLREKLASILALDYPRELMQILVISDGSEDRTHAITAEFAREGVELIRVPAGGKALALNAGMRQATGEILFFTDVRQPLAPDSLRQLIACFENASVGVVSGELVILDGNTHAEASVGLYWRYEKWIRNRLSQIDSVMGATGCIYAMRRELAVELPPGTLLDDVHLPLAAFFRGYRVIWDSSAKAFDYPTPLDAEFRRKVRTQAGVYQVIGEFPQLLGPKNRMWIDFMSHKLGRLLLPYACLLMAGSSFWLPSPWNMLAIAAQVIFYALAVFDLWAPEGFFLKRLTSPIRTFVVLMAAAFCAGSILFLPHGYFWKEAKR